jgi:dolichyl-diphosphooligosaccharide--protein glycosyltransferase
VLLAVLAFSLQPRVRQYREWTAHPAEYFSQDVVVSSTDSYRWFRLAEEARGGAVDFSGHDALRAYPEGVAYGGLPLLSGLMARLSAWLGIDVYRAGMLLMIPLSSLFLIPLGLYFFRIGYPLAGIWGGLVGSFSSAYAVRSFVHRVDTDGGNLFFVWAVALCILCIAPRLGRAARLAMAALTGAAIHAFCAWYDQPGFALVFNACLLLHLLASRFGVRAAAQLCAVCVLFSNPWNLVEGAADLVDFIAAYVLGLGGAVPGAEHHGLVFPSLLDEIAELQPVSLRDALARVLDPPGLALLGLLAFLVFAVRHWRATIPLLPLIALGALGLFRSVRFLMYLAPFVGIGYGYAFTLLFRAGARALRRGAAGAAPHPSAAGELLLYALGLLAFAPMLSSTAYARAPQPRIGVDLIASLQALKAQLPARSAVAHSWGHGYLVGDVTGAATLNDGELLDPVVEQLLDRGLVSPDPRALHVVLGFLAAHGRAGVDRALEEVSDYRALLARIATDAATPRDPLYLLLTDKMAREFSHYFRKAYWDFSSERGPSEGYDFRSCHPLPDGRLQCEKTARPPLLVDPERGTINGGHAVKKFVRVRAGAVVEELDHPIEGGLYLQLIEAHDEAPWELHLLKRAVFETNFNQMFVLGRYDPALFRSVHDAFPVARAYRWLRPSPAVR